MIANIQPTKTIILSLDKKEIMRYIYEKENRYAA